MAVSGHHAGPARSSRNPGRIHAREAAAGGELGARPRWPSAEWEPITSSCPGQPIGRCGPETRVTQRPRRRPAGGPLRSRDIGGRRAGR